MLANLRVRASIRASCLRDLDCSIELGCGDLAKSRWVWWRAGGWHVGETFLTQLDSLTRDLEAKFVSVVIVSLIRGVERVVGWEHWQGTLAKLGTSSE